ncbi:MAG: cation-translocating P-type ATPase [Acidimicrobiales bacterium]
METATTVDADAAVRRGLTAAEVQQRRAEGRTNDVPSPTSRTYGEITGPTSSPGSTRCSAQLVAILAVREYRDALFGIVLVLNALIGIVQEVRAKRTLDRLTLLSAPHSRVRRDGQTIDVPTTELVADDIIELGLGDQITVDGEILAGVGLEIDESLLTGEADPIVKEPGDQVLSGSFVVAGRGVFRATAVGTESYAFKLREDASRFTLVKSELRDGINTILKLVTWLIIPTGALLIWAQVRNHEGVTEAVQGSVAGMVAMVPEGLVLLTSMALAIGVLRLGKKNVLVQELAAIEGLARVDVLCVDKTGTLTEGRLVCNTVEHLGDVGEAPSNVLAAMARADEDPNPSMAAIAAEYTHEPGWRLTGTVPFSSARKWSANSFDGHGAWLLGAPDILAAHADADGAADVDQRVRHYAERGRRVLLLAHAPAGLAGEDLPDGLAPAALVVLEEKIRPDAPDTVDYFKSQGVIVKVISGDNPVTVGAVAERCGIDGADHPLDARTLPADLDELAEVMERTSVFGRVTPQQKREMVHALQAKGHEVAMTGDGVNDTLALKDAEIGVAMGSGSAAARSVARFVLLDNSFAVFPSVVAEGRRVIANVERVANLFLTKTTYAFLLALAVGVAGVAFPFYPRHLTIISSLTIGIPAFFLALAPNARRARPGFLGRVLRFAIPAGIVTAVATFTAYMVVKNQVGEDELRVAQTAATIVLFIVAMWVLSILARPFVAWRIGLLALMVACFVGILAIPPLRSYFAIELPDQVTELAVIGIAAIACMVLELGWRLAGWRDRIEGKPELVDMAMVEHHHAHAPDGRGTAADR